ncbi:hypothetical protein [uncultured Subdoligranulum sp.]|uniref:hypothetical protein n=1 Tax=uncultured Subdoligranulum sp. TaxID=512298 RepID=UPI0025E0AFFB|nr:hypothetical protein [uncultured Subdoligranulum sp.]
MLIAIDHGNKQVKSVHCPPFVSGLQQSSTRPFGRDVLEYQGYYYTLSARRIPYQKDKTADERYFILTLFAIANEIEQAGVYSDAVLPIELAVGLPLWRTEPGVCSVLPAGGCDVFYLPRQTVPNLHSLGHLLSAGVCGCGDNAGRFDAGSQGSDPRHRRVHGGLFAAQIWAS